MKIGIEKRFSLVLTGWLLLSQWALGQPTDTSATDNEATVPPARPLSAHPLMEKFKGLDTDSDGLLSRAEYLATELYPENVLLRDFKVFDTDAGQSIDFNEFLAVPYHVEREFRKQPDAVRQRASAALASVQELWESLTDTTDEVLSEQQFKDANLSQQVEGLQDTGFKNWDRDANQKLSWEEVRQVIFIAYGIQHPLGGELKPANGDVVDLRLFDLLLRREGKVSKATYLKRRGGDAAQQEEIFAGLDTNADQILSIAEHLQDQIIWSSGVTKFLDWDTNFNGMLSQAEIDTAVMSPGHRELTFRMVQAFDLDQSGELSLSEFQLSPLQNPYTIWVWAIDINEDGVMGRDEFVFSDGVYLKALSAFYFEQLDEDGDQQLSLEEWDFKTNHPRKTYRSLDENQDGTLSLGEFLVGNKKPELATRDYRVLDLNQDGSLSLEEYSVISSLVKQKDHKTLPTDPVIKLKDAALERCLKAWKDADADQSLEVSSFELNTAKLEEIVPAIEKVRFTDWDRNGNLNVDEAELRLMLEVLFGVRSWEGVSLRRSNGQVIDLRAFRSIVGSFGEEFSLKEYLDSGIGRSSKNPRATFSVIDQDQNGVVTLQEWGAKKNIWTNPLTRFKSLDTDQDAKLSKVELDNAKLAEGQKIFAAYLLPGFDLNKNGFLDLDEFRLSPLSNLFEQWGNAVDRSHNGALEREEFFFHVGPAGRALAQHYFTLIDLNQDGKIALSEWPFQYDATQAPRDIVFASKDLDQNQRLSLEELLGENAVPKQGQVFDLKKEKRFMRAEEAFREADVNGNGELEFAEFDSDAGLEVLSPITAKPGQKAAADPNAKNLPLYAILAFNALMLCAFGFFLLKKSKQV